MTDLLAAWAALFGVWPLAEPEHYQPTVMSVLDLIVHCAGMWVIVRRWKIVRRRTQYVVTWDTPAGTSTVTTTSESFADDLFRRVLADDPQATIERRHA